MEEDGVGTGNRNCFFLFLTFTNNFLLLFLVTKSYPCLFNNSVKAIDIQRMPSITCIIWLEITHSNNLTYIYLFAPYERICNFNFISYSF